MLLVMTLPRSSIPHPVHLHTLELRTANKTQLGVAWISHLGASRGTARAHHPLSIIITTSDLTSLHSSHPSHQPHLLSTSLKNHTFVPLPLELLFLFRKQFAILGFWVLLPL